MTDFIDKYAPIRGLMQTDSYKLQHFDFYNLAGTTTKVYSNWTNRGSRIADVDKVVHFGLQAFLVQLKETWQPFFDADEDLVVELYRERLANFLTPGISLDHIRELHRIGYLPLEVKAVPEGTRVPLRVPTFTIENTRPETFWLTNYIETALSATYWHPSTVATIAHAIRQEFDKGAERTATDASGVMFQAHDFSTRGMAGLAAAAASGAAHLLSFNGTDAIVALDWIDKYYGGDYLAASVPATEHSVMCSGSAVLGEKELFRRLINLYPTGFISIVSDTFDLWEVLTDFLPSFKDDIMARDGRVVIRPDSGDPVDILTGTVAAHDPKETPEDYGVISLLWEAFGGTINEKGFKVLDPHVGVIYGDSMNRDRIRATIERLEAKGFASTNFVAGVGSFSYQYNTRDTFGSAVKATWSEVDGVGYDLQKTPVTDDGLKLSAKGRLAVLRDDAGELTLVQQATPEQEAASELKTVWKDGEFVVWQDFANVREVLASS